MDDVLDLLQIKNVDDKTIVTHGQDISAVLKANQDDRLNTDEIWKNGESMKQYARIPLVVWLKLEKLGITQDKNALLTWINRHGAEYKMTTKHEGPRRIL